MNLSRFKSLIFVWYLSLCVKAQIELPPDVKDYIKTLHDTCIAKSGITEDEHASYDIEKNKDPKMMCYMKCLMLESQWMTQDGTIQYQFIEEMAPCCKDLLVNALNQCHNIKDGADLCEKSYNFNYCMKEADPKNWFFV